MNEYISLDLERAWKRLEPFCQPVSTIREVNRIIDENEGILEKCLWVLREFFTKGRVSGRSPLKGFLFEGPPGTGKTELARQIARKTSPWFSENEQPYLLFIDGATIATPKWGDAEKTLQAVFSFHNFIRRKVIVLFDDIESLMLARSLEIAKEWHFSINAVLFHELDEIDVSKTFVFATTNRPDLVDEALRDRLYPIKFQLPSKESLLEIAKQVLCDMGIPDYRQTNVLELIKKRLDKEESPTIRDVERFAIIECIEGRAWER
jgi:SpoVK/Ycf46/Vps4 family AAA+-type ATPase